MCGAGVVNLVQCLQRTTSPGTDIYPSHAGNQPHTTATGDSGNGNFRRSRISTNCNPELQRFTGLF